MHTSSGKHYHGISKFVVTAHKGSAPACAGTQPDLVLQQTTCARSRLRQESRWRTGLQIYWSPNLLQSTITTLPATHSFETNCPGRLLFKEGNLVPKLGFFDKLKTFFFFFFMVLKLFIQSDCFQGECYISDTNLFLRYLVTGQGWWEAHWAVVATELKFSKPIIFCLETVRQLHKL